MTMHIHSPESLRLAVELAFAAALPKANEHGVGLVVVVVDAAERVHYQTNLGPTMTAGMLSRCAGLYDAKPAAPHGVPVVLEPGLVVGSGISTHGPGGGVAGSSASVATGGNGQGGAGPAGRALGCDNCRDLVGRFHCAVCGFDGGRSVSPNSVGIIITGAVCSVVSDPPNAGGEGRTGGSHATSVVVMDQGGRVHESPPPLVIEVSPPAPSDEAAVPSYPGELDCPFIECKGCAQPIPAGDAYQLRVKDKLFAFHPGQFCPDCAARYDRGEIVLPGG